MALGGGTWTTQNKILPGTYINFAGVASSSVSLSERGYVAMPLVLDWGPDNTVFTVTARDFQTNCTTIFGRSYSDDEMLPVRELFKNTSVLYAYRLNAGGTKASNTFCTAKYTGIAGNDISTVINKNVDDENMYEVSTYIGTTLVDTQIVETANDLVSNDFVDFKTVDLTEDETTEQLDDILTEDGENLEINENDDLEEGLEDEEITQESEKESVKNIGLEETAYTPLTGGENGEVTIASYQGFLDRIESYSFNTLGCPTDDEIISELFVSFTKRMHDEVGAKFQTVIYSPTDKIADYEGVIELASACTTVNYGLVYWVTGASAGCLVNASNTNKKYDGELVVNTDYTQIDLENFILNGKFVFHNVNDEIKILEDITSLITLTTEKTEVFKSNQTIRVIDQIGNDIAVVFSTKYLGVMPNDEDGRISLWNDICNFLQELESLRAIENFDPETVQIEQGYTKKAVVCSVTDLSIVNAMAQLYMSVMIY